MAATDRVCGAPIQIMPVTATGRAERFVGVPPNRVRPRANLAARMTSLSNFDSIRWLLLTAFAQPRFRRCLSPQREAQKDLSVCHRIVFGRERISPPG